MTLIHSLTLLASFLFIKAIPVQIFSALQSYCSHLSVVLFSYDSRLTLFRLYCRKLRVWSFGWGLENTGADSHRRCYIWSIDHRMKYPLKLGWHFAILLHDSVATPTLSVWLMRMDIGQYMYMRTPTLPAKESVCSRKIFRLPFKTFQNFLNQFPCREANF